MGTIVITGSAGGIGQATRERLALDGHEVIGVDIRDAEVIADLSTPEGRTEMVGAVAAASGGRIDGLVAGAGITGPDPQQVVSINYFGAVATVEGLRPLLAQGTDASAVAISSNSSTTLVSLPDGLVEACLDDNEAQARELAGSDPGTAYATSKLALARWIRRTAIGDDWIGSGIRLNAVAPGLIDTPLVADNLDMIMNLGDVYPIPIGRPGRAAEVANLLAFLLSPDASLFCGSVVFMDGGSDAALNADAWPTTNTTAERWPIGD
ncbi:MAG: SDR family oxidoreductase [Acidimicrobiia bacterium]|nr:SDR family oxidoreductase [Acidimicrobiia bacterium]MYG73553.1 SDR family oxidoreductase [Acidimicrobiia bacterium]